MTRIQELVKQHSAFRKNTINLIASENLISSAAREVLYDVQLSGRYHASFYGGVMYIEEILKNTA
ncbi:MAG: serine hydroxymethyltransferase, partial [Candidatus Odinarchaeota archaeon]